MIIDGDIHISPHPGADRISADEALRRMDRAGVDRAICWLQPYYIPEVEQSNAYIHQAMLQHPDRILGFGWADPHLGLDNARDMIKRCVDEYGFYGIKLNGAQNNYYVDDPVLALPLIKEIPKAGKPLAFHVGSDAFERTHPFRVAKVARQFPELQILLVHMGGAAVPDMSDTVIEFAQQCPNLHLIGSCIYATRVWKAIQVLGPKRVSFGSDTPFFFTHVEVAKFIAMLDGEVSPVEQGYYFYKQVCRAGQAGMAVTKVRANDSELALIGFARNGSQHPDAFVVINIGEEAKDLALEIPGSTSTSFDAFRSSDDEQYVALGEFTADAAQIAYQAPPRSVTTFFGNA